MRTSDIHLGFIYTGSTNSLALACLVMSLEFIMPCKFRITINYQLAVFIKREKVEHSPVSATEGLETKVKKSVLLSTI
jgi:hypothetical protein